ncbi:flagellar basal body rod protein FlgB [Maridesulfovibrio salexigens]|uniref:Flagellar basal body rod protein FlgB n=1 Tax=Maridesulfovibrio salexigens (strain ATCC 14822 / DSM 2638 / NCIMB 8403 / VKM B-1763) TaxID=526222 RepID=C6C156_MARSD|nr:flagellar basal body rod protein FlgB [Maridesulfovibrio salexigens]ACS79219.1 flagellar basal-body rod protein FlgB [Maridesulfovibrio salexigens DSM 2638]
MKGLFGSHIQLTGKVLDLRLQRQNLVSSNLANVNTPGYKEKRLEFEEDLQKAMNLDAKGKMTRTSKMHIPTAFDANKFEGDTISKFEPRVIHGENRVDMDKEMVTMAKNTLYYNALSQVIGKNFQGMTKIIQEGAR